MTDEELDKARALEAHRLDPTNYMVMAIAAARLAREGWTPVDPDVLAVREVMAKRVCSNSEISANYRKGAYDQDYSFHTALAAYRQGKADQKETGE